MVKIAILDSGKITASTLAKQSFANLWNLINNRSNVPNPNDITGEIKFVYRRMPILGRNFNGYPFIVVSRTKPKRVKGSVDMTNSFMNYDAFIGVYSQDRDSNSSGDPSAADEVDDITDDIQATLNNVSNRKTLITQGMAHLEYDIESDEDEVDGKIVFVSEFDIRFINNFQNTG